MVNGTEKGCTDMALYEHVFLVRQDVSAQQVETIADQYKAVIESNGGAVKKVENWGLRALAYRVKKNRKAHYVLFNLDAPHAAVAEMERQQSLSEDILRIMTIRVDELEEGLSAMLQKRDRDDRDGAPAGRGDRGGFRGGDRGGPRRDRAPRRDEAGDME
ncbi:MAG: rpsF [Proteobacteria bacterium]|nr:rpsF [Pseudomonadota bacterium]